MDPELLDRLATACLALPEVAERDAWQGVAWTVRGRTFAHVLEVRDGRPPAYARVLGGPGPATVLTFWADAPDAAALRAAGPPHLAVPWNPTVVGLLLGEWTDWAELAELLAESHRVRAHGPGSGRAARARRLGR